MRAADVMSTRVVTTGPQTAVHHAARIMINNRISAVPIVEGDRQLVGIITEGDLLRRVETGTARQCSRWSEGSCRIRGWPLITSNHTRGE